MTRMSDKRTVRDPAGFYVIIPEDLPDPTPLFCPVCDYAMKTREDDVSYREFLCCERCAVLWAYPRREEWKNGWRPARVEVEAMNPQRSLLLPLLTTD